MTSINCLNPGRCPVPDPGCVDLRRLRLAKLEQGSIFHTAYRRRYWPELFNPSEAGNARFSPLKIDGAVIPTLYGGVTQTVVLLETAFHDVHSSGKRLISEALHLAPRGLVALTTPSTMPLVDLRDAGLRRTGLTRDQLVATSPEHYACTQEWAVALHKRKVGGIAPVGLLWQSRVAELAQQGSPLLQDLLAKGNDVFVLFGDRVSATPTDWDPGDPQYDDLTVGDARLLSEQIAEQLDAVIV